MVLIMEEIDPTEKHMGRTEMVHRGARTEMVFGGIGLARER